MPSEDAGGRGERRVFVEIGAQTPSAGPAEAWTSAHLLAKEGQLAAIPWQRDQRKLDEGALGELTVLPHLSDVAPGYVRLDLAIRNTPGARHESEPQAQSAAVKTTLILKDQQTIVLKTETSAGTPSRTLLVTPYIIRNDRDLKRLLQCKLKARNSAVPED